MTRSGIIAVIQEKGRNSFLVSHDSFLDLASFFKIIIPYYCLNYLRKYLPFEGPFSLVGVILGGHEF